MTATIASDVFARSIQERLFSPGPEERRRIGLEIEMLPFLAESGEYCPLEGRAEDGRSTLRFVREYGTRRGWREQRSAKGAPYFALPNGWTLTFEPGGQVELCTTPTPCIGELVAQTRSTAVSLRRAAADRGIELACLGIDPHNDASAVPLQIRSNRYLKMTRYFDSIGPSGVRMMRQTAATQVSVDGGADPGARWRLLADAAPYLTALFANSCRYAGEDTGYVSFRERCWRLLDPSRTGVPYPNETPCDAYTRFALEAREMSRTSAEGAYRPFAEWVSDGDWNESQWENHLTTLFPEVRPRGHLEVRSIDALPPEVLGAPVVLLAGVAYDQETSRDVRALLGHADEHMLNRAARCGLRDQEVAATAEALAELALRGARRLGDGAIAGDELERAEHFVREWLARERSSAGDR